MHVPFKSAPDAVTAVIRDDVQMYFAPVNLAKEQSRRRQGHRDRRRHRKAHPGDAERSDVHRGGTAVCLRLLVRPDGAGRHAAARFSTRSARTGRRPLKTPEMQTRLDAQFVIAVTDTPAAFDKIIAGETANLTKVFKEAGI